MVPASWDNPLINQRWLSHEVKGFQNTNLFSSIIGGQGSHLWGQQRAFFTVAIWSRNHLNHSSTVHKKFIASWYENGKETEIEGHSHILPNFIIFYIYSQVFIFCINVTQNKFLAKVHLLIAVRHWSRTDLQSWYCWAKHRRITIFILFGREATGHKIAVYITRSLLLEEVFSWWWRWYWAGTHWFWSHFIHHLSKLGLDVIAETLGFVSLCQSGISLRRERIIALHVLDINFKYKIIS